MQINLKGLRLNEITKLCDWPNDALFEFKDELGEHDPCYVIMPGGSMLPLCHHNLNGTDQARAQFIVDACNEKLKRVTHSPATVWHTGAPSKPWSEQWFIAVTTFGDRVALIALSEENSYDFKTADNTYIKRDKIVKWMQFPDSELEAPATVERELVEALGFLTNEVRKYFVVDDKRDYSGAEIIARLEAAANALASRPSPPATMFHKRDIDDQEKRLRPPFDTSASGSEGDKT